MNATNELLLILLGIAVLLLGVAPEFYTAPIGRIMRLVAALLGVIVILLALLR